MELTPVHIKGKRGQGKKPVWRPPVPANPLKRPRSEDKEGDENEERSRVQRLKTRKPPASIELLPSEILEKIFFMSKNFNFLRSSLRLGYRFSSRSFLSKIVWEAFVPTWEVWFGCPQYQIKSYSGYRDDDDRIGGDPAFQSSVLALPWVDIDLILEVQQKWYNRHGKGRYFDHARMWGPCVIPDPCAGSEPRGFDHGKEVAVCFETDWTFFIKCFHISDAGSDHYQRWWNHSTYIDVHPQVDIPLHLLSGPPDWSKAKLLFWLIRGGARLSTDHTWELTKRGYEYFMRSQDDKLGLVMFRLFNRLGVFETWPEFLLKEKRDMAKQKYKNRSLAEDTQSEQLWKAAYEGLRRWQDLDDRFPYRDNDAMLAALFKRSF